MALTHHGTDLATLKLSTGTDTAAAGGIAGWCMASRGSQFGPPQSAIQCLLIDWYHNMSLCAGLVKLELSTDIDAAAVSGIAG